MINVIFFGTPDIGLKSLEYLFKSEKINIQAVVTQPDKPSGRGQKVNMSPIKKFAIENNIPVFQPKSIRKEPEIIEELKNFKPDFFVTFAFGQILSQEVLDVPKYETINLHASLLPKYRGANPIQRVIIDGEKETGICTMITELGLDCGDVCIKLPIEIDQNMTCTELYNKISEVSPELIEETLIGIVNSTLTPTPQCEDGVCMANKLKKEECKIDWNKSAIEIHNLVRGVYNCPSAYFVLNGKIVKVQKTTPVEYRQPASFYADYTIGSVVGKLKDGVEVLTGDGILKLITVKPEGKGDMPANNWFNGVQGGLNIRLCSDDNTFNTPQGAIL